MLSIFLIIFVVEKEITKTITSMTVAELIEKLKTLPKDYQIIFESADGYGSAYYAYADDIEINHNTKTVEIKEI